jgi:CheY-like chemotaxis protein
MSDLLLDTSLTPEQTTYAKAVKTSGETLLSLIEEILDFSKIEAGRLDLAARAFDLPTLVEETVELIAPRAQAKELEIACYVEDRLPRQVLGDPARLRQVLLNLAGNAVKFTDKGGIWLTVERGSDANDIVFSVRDTGIGIAPAEQERIFLEFEQADSGAARKFVGTGLGLAITRRILERMGGRIGVESVPGTGATFQAIVPLPAVAEDQTPAFAPPDLCGKTILIVAPTAVEAALLARRLMQWGAHTCTVPDVTLAETVLPERAWSAVFADHALGRAACEALARATTSIAQRIVMVKPSARHELAALKEAGFTGYLVKPVRTTSLAARLVDDDQIFEHASGTPEPTRDVAAQATTQRGLAILIAEDNEINALLARALLGRLGHLPTITGNGAAAVEAWRAARSAGRGYDLILMDMQMPEIDGLEATRRIRAAEIEAGEKPVPILALTANAAEDDRAACLNAGMDGILVKPLDRQRLSDAIVAAKLSAATLAA